MAVPRLTTSSRLWRQCSAESMPEGRCPEAHLVWLIHSGEDSTAELAELFGVACSTVHRAVKRERDSIRADNGTLVTTS